VANRPGRAASSAKVSATTDPDATEPEAVPPASRGKGNLRELPVLAAIALVIAILIKAFLIQAFYIPSPSMMPTLQHGDRILVCRICTRVFGIHYGDVVVFASPHPTNQPSRAELRGVLHWLVQAVGVAQPDNPDYVKRVIGLPGDTIEIRNGQLFRNGQVVAEPYLNPRSDTRPYGPVTVPGGMLLVLGDNRTDSGDSRFQPPIGLGWVPENVVIGTAFVRVWPVSRWGVVH
jgi:signal peptidase I